jgi:hypothetical protein
MELKLDRSKSYGVIFGHENAQFEQNGRLFNGAGIAILPDDDDSDEANDVELTVENKDPVNQFITVSLAGGPVAQAALYKDAQMQGINWSLVKTEAANIGVKIEIVKGKPIWSLK